MIISKCFKEVSETVQEKWIAVANVEKLPPGSVPGVEAAGRDPVLANVDGSLHCAENVSTHAYALLSSRLAQGQRAECPLHGGQFDITTGEALPRDRGSRGVSGEDSAQPDRSTAAIAAGLNSA